MADHRHRFIVMGTLPDIDDWRRSRGLSPRDVIAVSTTAANALRGLSGCFEVVTLESWRLASARVIDAVTHNLEIVRLTSPPCPWASATPGVAGPPKGGHL